jgi:hypothetical protein
VLKEPRDNFIAGLRVLEDVLSGACGKAETKRLGHENSEDAVTWNVFRSLQEAKALSVAMRTLTGIEARSEPKLYLWGCEIGLEETHPWDALAAARNQIEPSGRRQTEPDCCLHVPGQAMVLIEAKFGSPMTSKGTEKARDAWLDRYERTCPGILSRAAIAAMPPGGFPEQILRNIVLALRLAGDLEQAVVVALVRRKETKGVEELARSCLVHGVPVTIREESWESLYPAVRSDGSLSSLARYMEDKSFRLRRAFDI